MSPETKIEDVKVGAHQRPHIVQCLLTLGTVPIEFHIAASRLQMPMNGSCPSVFAKGMEVGIARDYLAAEVKKMNPRPKYLFFFGDDMLPPWDGLIALNEEMEKGDWDVLTGLYYIKQDDVPTALVFREGVGWLKAGIHFAVGEVVWVDLTGLDFTLIQTDIFDKIERPYFKTGPTEIAPDVINAHTEDWHFMQKVRKVGGKIGVHTGVRVAHFDGKTGSIF